MKPLCAIRPYQNGKQEHFWTQIEGRLLPMLEGVADLTLRPTQRSHPGLGGDGIQPRRTLRTGNDSPATLSPPPDVGRPCPASAALKLAFTAEIKRTQRRSDGTISLEGIRFEVPSRYGHFQQIHVRVASWDLSQVHLADPQHRHDPLPALSAG